MTTDFSKTAALSLDFVEFFSDDVQQTEVAICIDLSPVNLKILENQLKYYFSGNNLICILNCIYV